jgi:predicted nucleotidyltransferase
MHADIAEKQQELIALCQRFDVARLEVFGSAARETGFDAARSDADFLVEFKSTSALAPLERFLGLAEALEQSRNYIRRQSILKDATAVYG